MELQVCALPNKHCPSRWDGTTAKQVLFPWWIEGPFGTLHERTGYLALNEGNGSPQERGVIRPRTDWFALHLAMSGVSAVLRCRYDLTFVLGNVARACRW